MSYFGTDTRKYDTLNRQADHAMTRIRRSHESVRRIEAEMPPFNAIVTAIRWCLDEYEKVNVVADKDRAVALLDTIAVYQRRLLDQVDT